MQVRLRALASVTNYPAVPDGHLIGRFGGIAVVVPDTHPQVEYVPLRQPSVLPQAAGMSPNARLATWPGISPSFGFPPRIAYTCGMDRDRIIATLRAHEPELRHRGIRHAALFGSVAARGNGHRRSLRWVNWTEPLNGLVPDPVQRRSPP
jgi:hypothetical protein